MAKAHGCKKGGQSKRAERRRKRPATRRRPKALRDFQHLRLVRGTPAAFRVALDANVAPRDFFTKYATLFSLRQHDTMVESHGHEIRPGLITINYVQKHRGLRVLGGHYSLVVSAGRVIAGMGRVASAVNADVVPSLSLKEVRMAALSSMSTRRQLPLAALKAEAHARQLLMVDPARGGRLIYRCTIVCGLVDESIDVDAHSGQALRVLNNMRSMWQLKPCTGTSVYNGDVDFEAFQEDSNNQLSVPFDIATTLGHPTLIDNAKGGGGTLDEPLPPLKEEITGNGGVFDPVNPVVKHGVSVAWATQHVAAYYLTEHNRVGILGTAMGPIQQYVNSGVDKLSAYSPTEQIVYYNAVGSPVAGVSIDSVSHELTHAVVDSCVQDGLPDGGLESGALNEGFANAFAALIRRKYLQLGWAESWLLFPEMGTKALQVNAPKSNGWPDTYQGEFWEPVPPDPESNEDVPSPYHKNGGVVTYCVYLLSQGTGGAAKQNGNGDSYTIKGVGDHVAGQIAYFAIKSLLFHGAQFLNARDAFALAAIILYGEDSEEHIAAENAWYAVGVGPVYDGAFETEPAANAEDVEPWVAELNWEIGAAETANTKWEVRVEDPTGETEVIEATGASLVNNVLMCTAWVPLRPETEYSWRVRRKDDALAPTEGWRPVRHFKTAAKPCSALSPSLEEELSYHPWQLQFVHSEVKGANEYQIEVYEQKPTFNHGVPSVPPILRHTPVKGDHGVVNVKIARTHWWRVRAKGFGDGNFGTWSPLVRFETSLPTVSLSDPPDGVWLSPWNLVLAWNPVKGAVRYFVDGTDFPKGFKEVATVVTQEIDHPKTVAQVELVPELTILGKKWHWRVAVLGPEPFNEMGKASPAWAIRNDGDQTVPKTQAPMHWHKKPSPKGGPAPDWLVAFVEVPFVAYGAKVTIEWKQVTDATDYDVSVYPFRYVPGGYIVDWANPVYVKEEPRGGGETQSIQIKGGSTPADGSQVYGYFYSVRAIRKVKETKLRSPLDPLIPPQSKKFFVHPGPRHGTGLYYVWAPPLTLNKGLEYDGDGRVYWNGGWDDKYLLLGASQGPVWSPSGKYDLAIYREGIEVANKTISGLIGTSYDFPDAGDEGYYYMRTHSDYGPTSQVGVWTGPRSFKLTTAAKQKKKDNPPDPPPPNIPQTWCDKTVHAGSNAPEEHIVMLGKQDGTLGLSFEFYDVPDRLTIEHDGQEIFDSGWISGKHDKPVSFSGKNDWVKVIVEPNHEEDTLWWFYIACP